MKRSNLFFSTIPKRKNSAEKLGQQQVKELLVTILDDFMQEKEKAEDHCRKEDKDLKSISMKVVLRAHITQSLSSDGRIESSQKEIEANQK